MSNQALSELGMQQPSQPQGESSMVFARLGDNFDWA